MIVCVMSSFESSRPKAGFMLINKPVGPTSHDIIDQLRQITGIKKIGHAGTLDPMAGGLLLVAIGREATKKINQFVKLDKKYQATLFLGAVSDTYDKEGKIKTTWPDNKPKPSLTAIKKAAQSFVGRGEQIPPMFSAKKIGGQKLYQLARAGKTVKRQPIKIEIYSLKILSYRWPHLTITVHCSSGTYIRTLAHDLGQRLGCGAYLTSLTRTAIGPFRLKQAITINELKKGDWQNFLLRPEKTLFICVNHRSYLR